MEELTSAPGRAGPVLVCCSVFRAEMEALARARWPGVELHFESSMLHMRPVKLQRRLDADVDRELPRHPVGLVYGDCCAGMTAIAARPGVARVDGLNCPEMLLGREEYRRLSHEGAFFMLPEWTLRWREVFRRELGLDERTAPELMGDMHRKLVYLDTGVAPIPVDELRACSAYTGLPFEIVRVELDRLAASVESALAALAAGAPR